jgi:hypothetical protein
MDKVRIFCEGHSDQRFLRDFIFLNYNIVISDDELKNNKKIHRLKHGWSTLKSLKITITEDNSDFISLIFLDADDKQTVGKAGIKETNQFIEELMESWNWKNYDKYVFPNNKDAEGEVEDFLEKIINKNNSDIFECWDSFENCLNNKEKRYLIPAKKSKIYLYHEALLKDKFKDPERDFKDAKLWDLDVNTNEYLKPLKTFLDQYLLQNE